MDHPVGYLHADQQEEYKAQQEKLNRPTPQNLARNYKKSFFGNGGGQQHPSEINITGNPEYSR